MQEERLMILKMIQEGKVTAQEGVELLKALREGHGPQGAGRTAQGSSSGRPTAAGDPGTGATGFAEDDFGSGHRPKSILEGVLEGIGPISFPFGFLGDSYKFEEDHEGRFEAAPGLPVTINFSTSNGRLILRGWERPDYRVHIIKTLRGPGEDEARQRARQMAQFTATPEGLTLESRLIGWHNSGVAAEVFLPAGLLYRVGLHTSNGRIETEGLKTDQFDAHTSNGRIVCERLTGERVIVRTSNGRIVANCSAHRLDADTSNGSITVVPPGGLDGDSRYQLRTSNGGIKIRPEDRTDCGYDIDASTSFGHIELELPELDYAINERTVGHRRSKAQTRGFDGKTRRIYIEARTSNGPILVSRSV
ncbi:MAG TPA: DUF4097 family beta strand repeat-containing protein [Bacillota bacterium]|jgi:hypothetical protein